MAVYYWLIVFVVMIGIEFAWKRPAAAGSFRSGILSSDFNGPAFGRTGFKGA